MPYLNAIKTNSIRTLSLPAHFILAGICLLMLNGCEHGKHREIYGDITNLPDTKIYLCKYTDALQRLDSTVSSCGNFFLRSPKIGAGILYLEFAGYDNYFVPVLTDGETLYISGNFNYQEYLTVSGSRANEELGRFRKRVRAHDVMLKSVEMSLAYYADSLAVSDSVLLENLYRKKDSLSNVITEIRSKFIDENPSSILSAIFVLEMAKGKTEPSEIARLLSMLDTDNMEDNDFLRELTKKIK